MKFEIFINFDGNCRDAVVFYANVFQSEVKDLMTYGQAPPDPAYTTPESDRDRIMYAEVQIGGSTVMFMDMPSDTPLVVGNNINPTIITHDRDEVQRWFDALKEGGEVHMELQKTFFSDLYAMVTDQFGVIWQILYGASQE